MIRAYQFGWCHFNNDGFEWHYAIAQWGEKKREEQRKNRYHTQCESERIGDC